MSAVAFPQFRSRIGAVLDEEGTLQRPKGGTLIGILVELIEQGIEARQQKEKAFFQLAERFRAANEPEQVKQLGD
jgi:hypothetical protein